MTKKGIPQDISRLTAYRLNMKEKIERWDWIASRWTQKDMMKVVNLLLKSDLIKEKHGQRVSKTNIRQVEFTLIENSLIVHQCLSNLINDTLVAKAKLKPSEKKLLREIRLAYRLFYDRVKCIRYGHNKK